MCACRYIPTIRRPHQPRLGPDHDHLRRLEKADRAGGFPANGLTYDCGVSREIGEDPVAVARWLGERDRIQHVHYRNVIVRKPIEDYTEVWPDNGVVDMLAVMKELVRLKYTRMINPEHARGLNVNDNVVETRRDPTAERGSRLAADTDPNLNSYAAWAYHASLCPRDAAGSAADALAVGGKLRRVQHLSAQDDLFDSAIGLDRFGRVLPQQQQIGALAHFHRADLAVQLQRLRVGQGRRLENLRRGDTRRHIIVHLQPAIQPRRIGIGRAAGRVGAEQQSPAMAGQILQRTRDARDRRVGRLPPP